MVRERGAAGNVRATVGDHATEAPIHHSKWQMGGMRSQSQLAEAAWGGDVEPAGEGDGGRAERRRVRRGARGDGLCDGDRNRVRSHRHGNVREMGRGDVPNPTG